MSHKRLKVKSRELMMAESNYFSLLIATIIAFAFGIMPLMVVYLIEDVITEDILLTLIIAFFVFLFVPLVTGIYRMSGLAFSHKEYGIADVFYAFSSVKIYFRVLLVNLFGFIKLLIPFVAGFISFIVFSLLLQGVEDIEWLSFLLAVCVGVLTLPLVKRFYVISYLTCVEDMSFACALKSSVRYTKGKSVRLAFLTLGFLPVTVLSFIAIMVPFVIYVFPFRTCLYSVICGELKRDYERISFNNEIKNDICPEVISEGVEEINE